MASMSNPSRLTKTFRTEDDVVTLLIHLGYLGYDEKNKCVFIPNAEMRKKYTDAVSKWGENFMYKGTQMKYNTFNKRIVSQRTPDCR